MTTNQEPLQNEEINSDYYRRYGKSIIGKSPERIDDDIVIFISLLKEYSEKLLKLCDERDRYQNRRQFYFLTLMLCLFPLIAVLLGVISSPSILKSNLHFISFLVLLSMIILGILSSLNTISNNNGRKLLLIYRDMRIYANKLEKLIRITSPLHEHLLSDVAKKIEVDFRLTDAESALEHYKNTKKNRLLLF